MGNLVNLLLALSVALAYRSVVAAFRRAQHRRGARVPSSLPASQRSVGAPLGRVAGPR